MNPQFTNSTIEVRFGFGERKKIGEELTKYNCKNVVIICDPHLNRSGKAAELVETIQESGIRASIYECFNSEPIAFECDTIYEYAKSTGCDGLIGLGDDYAMDSAKMVALLLKNGGKSADYIDGKGKKKTEIFRPIIAMPTTEGTHAEASPWIFCSPDGVSKGTAAHAPTLAIVDPEYYEDH